MKTLEKQPTGTGLDSDDPSDSLILLSREVQAMTFLQKVERVAPWLAAACLEGSIELDTQHNPVHAYVDAYYVSGNYAL